MSTIMEWLKESDFDFDSGRIIIQDTEEGESPGWATPESARFVQFDDPILALDFYAGFGGPECPRFVAEDDRAIYFPSQYDGATSIEVVHKEITFYLDAANPSPYPGG